MMSEEGKSEDHESEKWITFDDVLDALPKYNARFVVLKINVFIIGWLTSSANVFLVMNSVFHSQLPDNYETHKSSYIAVLVFLSLSEVVGFFYGLLLVYGSDISSPQLIRDSMILATAGTVSYWLALLTIFSSGLPFEMATQPLVMTVFTFASVYFSNSFYSALNGVRLSDGVKRITLVSRK